MGKFPWLSFSIKRKFEKVCPKGVKNHVKGGEKSLRGKIFARAGPNDSPPPPWPILVLSPCALVLQRECNRRTEKAEIC